MYIIIIIIIVLGNDQYNSINFSYIKKADGIILVYDPEEDISKIKQDLNFWIQQINEYCTNIENKKLWIVSNNKDLNKIYDEETQKKRIDEIIEEKNKIDITVISLNNLKIDNEVLKV